MPEYLQKKDDQVNSLTSQKSYFADYISSQSDMELSKVYFDEGISGTRDKETGRIQSDDKRCAQWKI